MTNILLNKRKSPRAASVVKEKCAENIIIVGVPNSGKVGEHYKVAYINTSSDSRMHKLIHFGISPGSKITLHQDYPSFVVKSQDCQLALEEDIAKEIYVWKNGEN